MTIKHACFFINASTVKSDVVKVKGCEKWHKLAMVSRLQPWNAVIDTKKSLFVSQVTVCATSEQYKSMTQNGVPMSAIPTSVWWGNITLSN